MTVSQVVSQTIGDLRPYFDDGEARALAREILLRLKGGTPVDIAVKGDDEVSEFIVSDVALIVKRLKEGEPIQYIFGVAHFYGMDFKVTPATLIPRPETATLVDMIVKKYEGRIDLNVMDLGTGSGCIAIALALNLRFPLVTAIDISEQALNVARENATRLNARVDFKVGDILNLKPEPESLDIIVSNPPYVLSGERQTMERNVLEHEPPTALFVPDNDPLKFYKPIVTAAATALRGDGGLYLEINPICADSLVKLCCANGLKNVEKVKYLDGKERFIVAFRAG